MEEIAYHLIRSGINIEARDINEETPFYSAYLMEMGSEVIFVFDALIQLGANPATVSSKGYICVDLAAMNLDPDPLRAFLRLSSFDGEKGIMASVTVRATALEQPFKTLKCYRFPTRRCFSAIENRRRGQVIDFNDVLAAYRTDPPISHTLLDDACVWGC